MNPTRIFFLFLFCPKQVDVVDTAAVEVIAVVVDVEVAAEVIVVVIVVVARRDGEGDYNLLGRCN